MPTIYFLLLLPELGYKLPFAASTTAWLPVDNVVYPLEGVGFKPYSDPDIQFHLAEIHTFVILV